jgi:hypothetical protein
MDLRELKAKGGFVSAEPVPREVEWKHNGDGKEVTDKFTVHVVKQSFGAIEKLFSGTDDRSRSAAFISECIRLGDGTERMTYEDAYMLDPGLAAVLVGAINQVNGTGKAKEKN